MAEDKVLLGADVVSRETPEYKELIGSMADFERTAEKVIGSVKPSLLNERYYTTEEIIRSFRFSRRALQNYRDKGIIPYTSIGGVILYPESKIREVLEKNYYKPTEFKIKGQTV